MATDFETRKASQVVAAFIFNAVGNTSTIVPLLLFISVAFATISDPVAVFSYVHGVHARTLSRTTTSGTREEKINIAQLSSRTAPTDQRFLLMFFRWNIYMSIICTISKAIPVLILQYEMRALSLLLLFHAKIKAFSLKEIKLWLWTQKNAWRLVSTSGTQKRKPLTYCAAEFA